jgi:membrane-associated phospholipid phosphatase
MHMMSITCAVVALGALFGVGPMLVASPLIPVVGAARLKLKRHTPAQVVAGSILGGALTFALILLLYPPA